MSAMGVFRSHTRFFSVMIIFGCSCFYFGTAKDTITTSQFIKDPETLSSNGSLFALGFFSPENSKNRYVGIWFNSESTVVWVANRNRPLRDSSGIVKISEDGNLVILNGQKHIIWSSNVSNIPFNSTCQLLNSGNLVLLDSAGNTKWRSFEHPSDSFLPNMKATSNERTGERQKLTSWRSPSDPSIGNFYMSVERLSVPEVFIWNENRPYWRSGPWSNRVFTGVPDMDSIYGRGFNLVHEGEETVYLTFTLPDENLFMIFVLNSEGKIQQRNWDVKKKQWLESFTFQHSGCDVYGICGAFGSCNSESSPICSCLRGFEPRDSEKWNRRNWTDGCIRRTALQCQREKNGSADGKKDGFLKLEKVKVPDFGEWSGFAEDDCRRNCLDNCTCIAYSYDSGIGCLSWRRNLIDIQEFSYGGIDLYIRVSHLDLEGKGRDATIIITIPVVIGAIIIATGAYILWKHSVRKRKSTWFSLCNRAEVYAENTIDNVIGELITYDFEKIAIASNNFNLSNKLGRGGFGPVYKGVLQDGQKIAVKRLSRASGQGLEEFMNEVVLISKLQHRNLVRLLGCCVEGDEKILIYEYMENKSLDAFIFDPSKHKLLDWRKRFDIIGGVARGILYLHRDSRLKIIHRDLKASNILLDEKLNPKISDFGMARIFKGSEDHANTRRIVGTYGYMSPEYAMEGLFSEKSDVFSFGILLLEIVNGRRNSSFYNNEHSPSLLGFAWKLWKEDNLLSLINLEISDPNLEKEILRCIHIGLLCVQDLARERPSMSTVISMLNSEIVNLPTPKQPAFIQWQRMLSSVPPTESCALLSNNSVSITDLQGR